ncbi:DUF2062 domain-containing protein [Acidicapsa dinghuensis]|uniref:DUF2062 domain-containing protein n=1 Tax=Acidicapsa dinghuensis TaxID=2218256 RepID=A0ABW1EKI3_9BACT|nr:DUF2062 domain-containing protein [Acidicapsa dinghuensis]
MRQQIIKYVGLWNQLASRLRGSWPSVHAKLNEWLGRGISPRQLAFTLALGFALGCLPMLGVSTAICAVLAMALRLNMPAIQAANWIAMPFQVILLVPFLRLGQWIVPGAPGSIAPERLLAQMQSSPWHAVEQMGGAISHAILAWGLAAGPALLLLTVLLTPVIHRVSRPQALEIAE